MLVNAPAIGDAADWEAEAERLIDRLGVRDRIEARALRTPGDLERETGGVAGAIYGVAPHGRLGTLRRPATTVRGDPRPVDRRRDGAPRRRAPARRARRRADRAGDRAMRRLAPLLAAAALLLAGCGEETARDRAHRRRPARRSRSSAPRGSTTTSRSCSSCTAGARPSRALPALARAPRPRGQRRDLPALPGLVRRAARAGARQRRARRARSRCGGSTRTPARSSSPGTRPAARSPPTTRRSRGPSGLPPPRAVFAAYPGRRFAGARIGIPSAGTIPPGTEVLALRGADDRVVDQGAAREIGARGRLLVVRTAGARDHLAPQRDDPVSRREFWDRLDALIADARR